MIFTLLTDAVRGTNTLTRWVWWIKMWFPHRTFKP